MMHSLKIIELRADNLHMDSLRFVELATVIMTGLVVLMVIITVSVKAVRYLKVSWYKRHYRKSA